MYCSEVPPENGTLLKVNVFQRLEIHELCTEDKAGAGNVPFKYSKSPFKISRTKIPRGCVLQVFKGVLHPKYRKEYDVPLRSWYVKWCSLESLGNGFGQFVTVCRGRRSWNSLFNCSERDTAH